MRALAIWAMLAALPQQPVYRADVELMTTACVVADGDGTAVHGLTRDDFRLFDNSREQELRGFWTDDQLPLSLALIVDVSASQSDFLREHESTVERFLTSLIHANDRAFVVAVNERVTLKSQVSAGPNGLRYKLLPVRGTPLGVQCGTVRGRSLCGGTALWNAVYAAAGLKLADAPGSKAIIILSDGQDTGSTHGIEEALAAVRDAGATVYTIRYPDAGVTSGPDGLDRLSTETGGKLYRAAGANYSAILRRIESDLRSRYILGFHPHDAAAVDLRVETRRPGLSVRCSR